MSKDSLSPSVSVSRIIPKEESSDFQTWAAPEVKSKKDEELEELASIPMLTAEQLEEIHQQAYQEGYQEGQARGYSEGLGKGEEEGKAAGHKQAFEASLQAIQNQTFHFEQIFKSLQEPLTQVSEQVEHEIVTLAVAIAKQIVGEQLNNNPEYIVRLVKQTLHLLPSKSQSIKIYLHPSDLKLIKNAFELEDDLDISKYQLYDDMNITRGGCIVDTDISHIDASLDKRIADIAKSLIPPAPEAMAKSEHSEQSEEKVEQPSPEDSPQESPQANPQQQEVLHNEEMQNSPEVLDQNMEASVIQPTENMDVESFAPPSFDSPTVQSPAAPHEEQPSQEYAEVEQSPENIPPNHLSQ